MLFGQSVFQSVVARLEREAEELNEEEDSATFGRRVIFDPAPLQTSGMPEMEPDNRPLSAYLDLLEDVPPAEAPIEAGEKRQEPHPAIMPDHLQRTSLAEVSEELGIGEADTLDSLTEKRRRFARVNHPDAVPAAFRQNAHLRMTAANLLIDQAVKLLALQGASRR